MLEHDGGNAANRPGNSALVIASLHLHFNGLFPLRLYLLFVLCQSARSLIICLLLRSRRAPRPNLSGPLGPLRVCVGHRAFTLI